ncbi:OmpA family protein [Pseudaeromonas sp. ZJS20]|uniref:OmpA family protein n=1 Tax=Pseudaeromonas aegiceratis TaxID=3153928 RepID=UPI00390C44D3
MGSEAYVLWQDPPFVSSVPARCDGLGQSADGSAITMVPVHFAVDRSELDTAARATLDCVAQAAIGQDYRLQITGHTDSRATEAYNLTLGSTRAQAVAYYLIGQGVDPSLLDLQTAGESQPVANNNRSYGRQLNRRVAVVTLSR